MSRRIFKDTAKLGKNTFYMQVFNIFTKNPFIGYNFKQVSKQLGIVDKSSRALVLDILEQLCAAGEIVEAKRGKYKLNPDKIMTRVTTSIISGVVDMKNTGKAYVIREDSSEDVYIASNNTGHALNGDIVKVQLLPKRSGRKLEGQIIEIVERKKKHFVGLVEVSRGFAFLIPDDPSMIMDILIPGECMNGAKNGEKAIARITDWPRHSKNPIGEIEQVLGKPGDNNVEMSSILVNFDFPLHFSKRAESEAENIPFEIPEKELASRRDFRNIFTCTIDPEDAKDFDDALSLRKLDNGLWEVGVHIADVSHYVRPGMAIDEEAYERGTSVYLVDRTFPMLPEKLSNHVCSLRPAEEKLCFSAVFEMDDQANISNEWFGKTIIKSSRRYAYEEVQAMIEGGAGDYKNEIMTLNALAFKLREQRFGKGSINFRSKEVKFRLDPQGKPLEAFIKEQKESHKLIEDFMLLANRKVAEKIGLRKGNEKPKTFVYRVHDVPNPEKLLQFGEFLRKLGYSIKTSSRKALTGSFNQLFEEVAGKGEENMIETIAIRTMAKAVYSVKNIGHYGLGFQHYTHFTSPIRRYPDLMVHRLLEMYMAGKPSVNESEFAEKCKHASDMEKNAADAERDSVKLKQAEFMMDKIGQTFTGLISGVSKWGLFVELDITKGEGLVSMQSMKDDFYYLDEDNYKVIGSRYGKEYKLGHPVKVKVRHVDLARKQMDFELVE